MVSNTEGTSSSPVKAPSHSPGEHHSPRPPTASPAEKRSTGAVIGPHQEAACPFKGKLSGLHGSVSLTVLKSGCLAKLAELGLWSLFQRRDGV